MGNCHWQVANLIHTVSVYLIWWGFFCLYQCHRRHYHLHISHVCQGFFIGHPPGIFHVDGHILQPEHHKHCRQKHYLSPPASPPPYFHCIMLLLPTSLDTPSFSPSAMNSLSTDCIVLTTCFSNSSSCIHTRCQQSPPAPPRSHQDCTWTVMVSKILGLLPSCSAVLTCLINFSSLSPTNVAGLHLLSSSATFIKWDNALPMHGWAQAGSHSILLKLSDLVRHCLLVLCPTLYHISHAWKDQRPRY